MAVPSSGTWRSLPRPSTPISRSRWEGSSIPPREVGKETRSRLRKFCVGSTRWPPAAPTRGRLCRPPPKARPNVPLSNPNLNGQTDRQTDRWFAEGQTPRARANVTLTFEGRPYLYVTYTSSLPYARLLRLLCHACCACMTGGTHNNHPCTVNHAGWEARLGSFHLHTAYVQVVLITAVCKNNAANEKLVSSISITGLNHGT